MKKSVCPVTITSASSPSIHEATANKRLQPCSASLSSALSVSLLSCVLRGPFTEQGFLINLFYPAKKTKVPVLPPRLWRPHDWPGEPEGGGSEESQAAPFFFLLLSHKHKLGSPAPLPFTRSRIEEDRLLRFGAIKTDSIFHSHHSSHRAKCDSCEHAAQWEVTSVSVRTVKAFANRK